MMIHQQKMIVYVTKQALMASLWHGHQYQSSQSFQNQASDHAVFRQYLLQHQHAIIYLVIDTVEEEYQLEVLPKVATSVKQAMLARKLSQFSRNSAYKTAWFMRQTTTIRKENIFVLLSLTNTQFLQQWIEILQSTQALLAGMVTLPMLNQIMARQRKITPPALLICEHLSSGFRQSYLEHGRLRISRLTPIENKQPSHLTDFYVAEVEKLHMYLLSQRILSNAIVLQVMLFSHQAESFAVAKILAQQGIQCVIANRSRDIDNSHLQQDGMTMYPELCAMQWLIKANLPANLASVEMTKAYRLKQLRRKFYWLTAAVIWIGAFIAGYLFLLGYIKNERINDLTKQADALLKQHALVVKRHPESLLSGDALKLAVTAAEGVSQQSPVTFMQIVSAVLTDMPEISVSRISWLQTDQNNEADKGNSAFEKQSNNENKSPQPLLQIGFLSGHINQSLGDYQQALDSMNRLISHLRKDTRVRTVTITQAPADVKLIEGSTSHLPVIEPARVMFTLKIVLNPLSKGGE
jgi:hypothetical protein